METGFEYETSFEFAEFAVFGGMTLFIFLGLTILMIVSYWKVFQKAGKQGWEAIVPIYNLIVLMQISKTPLWMLVLVFIPIINFIGAPIVMIAISLNMAKVFGKDTVFGILLIIFPYIMYPILAFGPDQYIGEKTEVPIGE